jgi:hypothetical protein
LLSIISDVEIEELVTEVANENMVDRNKKLNKIASLITIWLHETPFPKRRRRG